MSLYRVLPEERRIRGEPHFRFRVRLDKQLEVHDEPDDNLLYVVDSDRVWLAICSLNQRMLQEHDEGGHFHERG